MPLQAAAEDAAEVAADQPAAGATAGSVHQLAVGQLMLQAEVWQGPGHQGGGESLAPFHLGGVAVAGDLQVLRGDLRPLVTLVTGSWDHHQAGILDLGHHPHHPALAIETEDHLHQ